MMKLLTDFDIYDTPVWGLDPELQAMFKRAAQSGEEHDDWPLDAPDVKTIDLKKLRTIAATEPEVIEAIKLIDDPTTFEKLFNHPVQKKPGRVSGGIAKGLRTLIKSAYIAPEPAPKAHVGLFTRPKPKKRTKRMIVDGRPVNHAQRRPPHVPLPGLHHVREALKYKYVVELDGVSYFNQFKLNRKIRRWFAFKVGKQTWSWTRMPMGWAHSVHVAQTVTNWLAKDLQGVHVLTYIDNVYIFGNDIETITTALEQFLARANEINATFEISTPIGETCKVLGMDVDLTHKTIQIPQTTVEKLQPLAQQFTPLHDERAFSYRMIWIIIGNAMWGARILNIPMCDYPNLTAWICEKARLIAADDQLWTHRVRLWPKARQQLQDLLDTVCENNPWEAPSAEGIQHTMYTDASDVGYATIHSSELGNATCAATWTPAMTAKIIAERELYAAKEAIRQAARASEIANMKLQSCRLYTDNTNCVSWLTKRRAKSFFANAMLREVVKDLQGVPLIAEYIQSTNNPADRPSRVPGQYGSVWPPYGKACSLMDYRPDQKATIGGPSCTT
jgi:hypothetical protein